MKRTKVECEICHKLISKSNLSKHLRGHEKHPEQYLHETQSVQHDGLNCIYCNKLCKNKNSLAQHECRCNKNPNKIAVVVTNSGRSHTAWNRGLTKETDERVAKASEAIKRRHEAGLYDYSKNKHTQETKEKIRQQKLALCAQQGTNLCGKGLRGYYKGYYCQSSWELAYVIYNLEHNIVFERNKKCFKYILDGIERSYFPDFYIPATDTYIEIKGYYDRKTKEKEKQFVGKLIIYKLDMMKPILKYVIEKYGKDFVKLYE